MWKKLLELTRDETLENLRRNNLIFRIAREALYNGITGEVMDDGIYDEAFITWDRKRNAYILVAREKTGNIAISFPDEYTATILRDGVNDLVVQVLLDKTVAVLKQCIALMDIKTKELEKHIARSYLKETRYGSIDYLEEEFKEFAKDKMETFTDHSGREVYDHMPFKFNYKGRLKEYLQENGADTTNLHIIN